MPFRKVENCNQVIRIGRQLKFSLVNVAGNDFVQGNKKLILGNALNSQALLTFTTLDFFQVWFTCLFSDWSFHDMQLLLQLFQIFVVLLYPIDSSFLDKNDDCTLLSRLHGQNHNFLLLPNMLTIIDTQLLLRLFKIFVMLIKMFIFALIASTYFAAVSESTC